MILTRADGDGLLSDGVESSGQGVELYDQMRSEEIGSADYKSCLFPMWGKDIDLLMHLSA